MAKEVQRLRLAYEESEMRGQEEESYFVLLLAKMEGRMFRMGLPARGKSTVKCDASVPISIFCFLFLFLFIFKNKAIF